MSSHLIFLLLQLSQARCVLVRFLWLSPVDIVNNRGEGIEAKYSPSSVSDALSECLAFPDSEFPFLLRFAEEVGGEAGSSCGGGGGGGGE